MSSAPLALYHVYYSDSDAQLNNPEASTTVVENLARSRFIGQVCCLGEAVMIILFTTRLSRQSCYCYAVRIMILHREQQNVL